MSKEQFDKHTDFLARKAAENYSIAYTDEAWHKMELLLDKKKKKRFVLFWLVLAGVVAVSSTVLLWLPHQQKTNKLAKEQTNYTPTTSNTNQKNSNNSNNNIPHNSHLKNKILTVQEKDTTNNQITTINEKQPTKKVAANNTITATAFKASSLSPQQLSIGQKEKDLPNANPFKKNYPKNGSPNTQLTEKKHLYAVQNIEDNSTEFSLEPTQKFEKKDIQNIFSTFQLPTTKHSKLKQLTWHDSVVQNNITPKNKPSFIRKLDVALAVVADATTDGKRATSKISNGIGLLLSYPISKKTSITTGFLVAKKLYEADSTSYKITYSLGSRYKLTNIDATCIVYEIPFQFNYLVAQKNKNSYFASAGLSTYLMKSEDYTYTYLYNGDYVKYPYRFTNANSHILSVLSVSAAYKRSFSKHFSYQLMPYAKIPLTGIGNGRVSLYSFGVGLSVHYKQ